MDAPATEPARSAPLASDWMVPDWPAPANVKAVFTARGQSAADGASAPPHAFFNLGDHVADAAEAVRHNRRRLQAAMGARPVFMQQVHGVEVLALGPQTPDGKVADAAVTAATGLACTVMVADCLPVLITDVHGRAVAAAHAGWRGLAAGVLQQAVRQIRALALDGHAPSAIKNEANETSLLAWLGPCIGPQAFEVGGEVRDAFMAGDAGADACFRSAGKGKYFADLPALARRVLGAQGITRIYGNDGSAPWCTVQQPTRYFSHRRDHVALGATGRMAACIWLA